ncbi:MAG: hypothetical protein DMG93_18305 [Acidobacteria bacterium]|nr:MAG: hypothetical protein DMG93_18305 [Acidobacteriota bacterium]
MPEQGHCRPGQRRIFKTGLGQRPQSGVWRLRAPGRFVCPHGACFDHEGNVFVVEWVEAGRVTKLRRIAYLSRRTS